MKTRSKLMSRLLSLALCICMVLALLPAIPLVANAANATAGSKIYLQPNSNWKSDSAWFAAYFFNNTTGENQWVSMSDSDGNGIYECSVPSGTWPNVIFCRMNPASTQTDWSYKWDQTNDLSFTSGKDLYTVTEGAWSNGSGSWSTATCAQVFHNMSGDKCTRCGVEGCTVYFQNNWEWQNVKVYYWKGNCNNSWPGETVDYYGEAVVDGITRYYSVMTVPADVDGFIINGTNNSNTGTNKQDQTATITMGDWYDGVTYCLDAYTTETDGHHVCQVKDFPICKDFAKEHKFVENVCTRCDVTWCQLNGHVDVDGEDEAAAEGEDNCDVCGVALRDIFFKNDWDWSDIRLYYWYEDGTTVPAHPGLPMDWYGENHGYDYYRMKVPTGIAGFVISGYKNDNSGTREQTVNITSGWYDGATYYVTGYQNENCGVDAFPICVDFPNNHRYETNSDFCKFCGYPSEVTIYFKNNWNWTDVTMRYWGSRIADNDGAEIVQSMEWYGKLGAYDYYRLTIPADCDGIKFIGNKDDGTGLDQSPDITSGWYEGITYYMVWDDENKVGSFKITEDFPCTYEHTEEIIPAVAPTCADTGLTEGVQCSVCDEILTAQVEVPATGNHADVDKKDGRCDVCGCLMQDVYLAYTTASLEGNIAVNYFMLLSDEVLADETAYMQFTMADGEVIKVPVNQSKLIDGYDVFTCEVAAKEMTDIITSQFYYGGEVALEHSYNVRAYAKHIIKNSNDPYAKALMEAMVNYGAASQAHFGYHTDDLANTDVATAPDYSKITIDEFPFTRGQGTEKVKLYSASLILNSETTLRLFFNGNITATHNNKNLEVKQRSGLYYVDIVDIAAKELDDDVTITINDGTESAAITFSPLAYCQIVEKDTTGAFTTEMRNLAIALYLYNKAAGEYFGDAVIGPQGIGLKTALNNYEGNESNTITGQVTSVTFGRSNQYRDIANSYTGTLVDVDQDTPAYAYYVDNGSGYDVYVLSNDVIYTPADCSNLCNGMSNLVSFDTSNLDVSRTTSMYRMFRDCGKLAELDVSNWDTSNVTSMRDLFRGCQSLPSVDVSKWDTHNVTSMLAMFQDCKAMAEIYVDDWDTSNVTEMTQMFNRCTNLSSINVSGWDTGKVTIMYLMFAACEELTSLDLSDWDVSNVENFGHMFTNYTGGSYYDMKLSSLDVSGWDTGSAISMECMFYGLTRLTKLDLSRWDVSKVETMSHMFSDCYGLSELNLKGWDTSSLEVMDGMFNDCDALVTLDVSDFDTQNVKEFCQVFESCGNLVKIVGLNNWDTANGCTFEEMFSGCVSLKELDLSSFDTRNARDGFKGTSDVYNAFINYGANMLDNLNSLEKLILGENFDFNGNSDTNRPVVLPKPASIDGQATKWYNAEIDTYYDASEIPEKTAATYVAAGATMYNALHYLNGDKNSTQITTQVNSVTFGLKENNLDIVNNNTGVLMNVEQDTPAYAYYVDNGSGYDVYVLSNDVIYAPADSTNLFKGMTNMTSMETDNFDVSRVKLATFMFRDCTNLPKLDATGWDTSNITNMQGMFYKCNELAEIIGINDWDVSNVTTLYAAFYNLHAMTELDLSGWNVSKVTDLRMAICRNDNLSYVDLSNWNIASACNAQQMLANNIKLETVNTTGMNTSGITSANAMFDGCQALTTLTGSENWKLSNVVDASSMFTVCQSLTYLDVTGWDMSNVTTLERIFYGCKSLKEIEGLETWDTGNVTTTFASFYECNSLENLESIGAWDTGSVTDMRHMFRGTYKLSVIDVANWDVSNVTTFYAMFCSFENGAGDMPIKVFDVSKWNTASVTDLGMMFYGCAQLTSIDMSSWDVSKVTNTSHMFADCFKLESIDFTGWNTVSLTNMDGMFNDCRALQTVDVSDFDTQNVTQMGQVFENCISLTTIIGLDKWDTSNVVTMEAMFSQTEQGAGMNTVLKTIDLSTWNTSKVTNTKMMFRQLGGLETIYVGDGWDMSNVTNSESMFAGSPNIVGGNSTTYDSSKTDKTYACVDTEETPGYLTYKAVEDNANP